ncbi:MAG: TnpV protein [Oscillospiraceae bacterium]|nr:TnpV protein [Oscillospiraceae bacterium]
MYERLILNGTLYRHLADANERATSMLERLVEQMAAQVFGSGVTSHRMSGDNDQ